MARRLRKYVIPTISATLITFGSFGVAYYKHETKPVDSNYKFTIKELIQDKTHPVLEEIVENKPLKPYIEETVGKSKDFYRSDDDEETQKNSLIYYEKTYMPSTGIMYSSDEVFDIYSVLDGEVSNVGEDNILGRFIEINHSDGYKTTYYSLSETNVTKGVKVTKGDVIGISGDNKIEGTLKNNLLFETYKDGYLIDPEDFYNTNF